MENEEQEVDSLIKLAKAAAIAADTSSVLLIGHSRDEFPLCSSISPDDFVHGNVWFLLGYTLISPDKRMVALLQKEREERFRNVVADLQSQNLKRSLKRPGADVEQPKSKKSKSSAAPQTLVSAASSIMVIWRPRTESFIGCLLSNDDSDVSDDDSDPLFFWHVFAAWEVVPTGLGDVNALYFTDKSSKYFTHLREILHLLDRHDLSKLYGMVVKHYEVNPLAGTGLILWGDLHVLFESTTGGSSVEVWNDQQEWVIRSWKLFPFSGVHVLETFTGKILYMFADTPYPLSASLMKKMLKHKLEVEIDGVGNDMTYVVQLIKFIKNQLASSVPSA
ncbi:hypothetical protein Tco_0352923 [Tanacetum coccineum]